jgi:hypothetical protein
MADVLLIENEIFEQNLNCLNWGTLDLFFEHESLKKQKTPKNKITKKLKLSQKQCHLFESF